MTHSAPKFWLALLLVAAIVGIGWIAAFWSGAFPYLGHQSGSHERSFGGVASSERRSGFGLKHVYLNEGSEVFFEYDVTPGPRGGKLAVAVSRRPVILHRRRFHAVSGSGELVIPIRETGVYQIDIMPNPASQISGGSIDYSLTWGARL